MVATFRGHVGLAQETSYGTTASAATVFLPVLSYDEWDDDQGLVLDEAMRNAPSKLYASYTGPSKGSVSYTFPYFNDVASRFWPLLLGLDTIGSSSNGGWQHAFSSTDTPHSLTIFDFVNGQSVERQWTGAQMESLNFKFERNSGMATVKPVWKSFAPSTGISEQTPTYTSTWPFRGWNCVFSVAASTKATLLGLDMTITREINLIHAANQRYPSAVEVGQLDIAGKISWYGSTDGPYTDYRANTQQALEFVFTDTGSGSTYGRLDILMTKALYTKVTPDRSGPFMRYDVDFRAVHNATDSGPANISVTVATSSSFST